jgi:hypothetical protein
MRNKPVAIALVTVFAVTQLAHQGANAQPALVIVPAGAAIVVLGGMAYYAWFNTLGQEVLVPVSSATLEDPEEETQEYSDYIWGDSQAQAERKCKQQVENGGGTYVRVRRLGNSTKYECIWRGAK